MNAQHTAGLVRFHRSVGLNVRRRRIPRQRYPKSIEMEYGKAIVALVQHARTAYAPLLTELPALLARVAVARQDDNTGESDAQRARRLIAEATMRLEHAIRPADIEALAHRFATRTEQFQKGQLQKQVRAALGVDVAASDAKIPTLVEHFVAQNLSLIKSIPADMSTRLDKSVTQAFTTGQRHEDLAREIQARFDIGERHARLIARDQCGKLFGQVAASRHQSIGITKFEWSAIMDERTRPEHEDLNGQVFSYDNLPDEGLPGEPVCCRCGQQPIFDDILDALDSEDD